MYSVHKCVQQCRRILANTVHTVNFVQQHASLNFRPSNTIYQGHVSILFLVTALQACKLLTICIMIMTWITWKLQGPGSIRGFNAIHAYGWYAWYGKAYFGSCPAASYMSWACSRQICIIISYFWNQTMTKCGRSYALNSQFMLIWGCFRISGTSIFTPYMAVCYAIGTSYLMCSFWQSF